MIYSRPMLETFIEVCRQRNFSHAASKLRKSQSCVSMQISQIERELGLPLFNRAARPFTITEAGLKLAEFAGSIKRMMDECDSYMKDMAIGSVGELKIGTLPSLVTFLVSPVLTNIVNTFPNVSIHIAAFAPPTLYEALRQGEIDFGILLAENAPPEFDLVHIRDETLYFVVSATHHLTQSRGALSIGQLREAPFVLGSPGNDYTTLIDQSFRKMGIDPYRVAVRISNFEGMKKAIAAGIGLGILPRFAVQEELKQGSLRRIHVKGVNIIGRVVLIQNRKVMSLPAVENIKNMFAKELAGEKLHA